MTEVVPGTLALRREERRGILFSAGAEYSFICGEVILSSAGEGHSCHLQPVHFLFSVAGAFFHLRREHFLVSGGGAFFHLRWESFSCHRGRCILSSAVPEHLLIRQLRPLEGKTYVHRARYCSHFAAVGSLSMPSAILSLQNRGRWKPFYMSTGRAHENTPPSPQKMPCLRECLVFTLRNARPAKANVLSFQRGRGIFSSAAGPGHPFICGGSIFSSAAEGHSCHLRYRSIFLSAGPGILSSAAGVIFLSAGPGHSFICGGSHSLVSEGGASFHLRYRSIC